MKQALILCGGEAKRLRPYSHSWPKAGLPFLNLPLLSYGWFYMEQLGVSQFLLNSHLFPEKLKSTVDFLSQPPQTTDIFFESKPLGGAGILYKLRALLQNWFFYLNGDSLFFPSHKKQLLAFEEDFLNTGSDGSFFASPINILGENQGVLWGDEQGNLKFVGAKKQLSKKRGDKRLRPFYFSGLALFKSSLLSHLRPQDFYMFEDFVLPLLEKKRFKIFSDKGSQILEAGKKQDYIESMKFCLDLLFLDEGFLSQRAVVDHKNAGKRIRSKGQTGPEDNKLLARGPGAELASKQKELAEPEDNKWLEPAFKPPSPAQGFIKSLEEKKAAKLTLEEIFARFDSKDEIVGLKNGKIWGQKLGWPLLAPKSTLGLKNLKLKGGAVLGAFSHLFGESCLMDSVLGPQVLWRGNLEKEIILKNFIS